MRKCASLLLSILCTLTVWAGTFNPVVNYAVFQTPEEESYLETYFLIGGNSVSFVKTAHDQYQAAVEITSIFKQGENIVQADKYVLNSKTIAKENLNAIDFNLIDLQRFSLPQGTYQMELTFRDLNDTSHVAQLQDEVNIVFEAEKVGISDIVLIEKHAPTEAENVYSKNGFDLIPNVGQYYPESIERLTFYTEIYGTDKVLTESDFVVIYSIKHGGSNRFASNKLRKFKKYKQAPVNVLLAEFDISELTSGNYDLCIEIRSKTNDLLAQKRVAFQRNKVAEGVDLEDINLVDISETFVEKLENKAVVLYTKSVRPLLSDADIMYLDNVVESGNVSLMRRYLYNYWTQQSPQAPAMSFANHKALIDELDEQYGSSIFEGFETDRGIVYLKYGAPNDLIRSDNEPGAYPYTIWQYYKLNTQSNVKFVFYNPNLSDNDYELIHSDLIGEIKEPRWEFKIYNSFKEQSDFKDFNNSQTRKIFGSKIGDID